MPLQSAKAVLIYRLGEIMKRANRATRARIAVLRRFLERPFGDTSPSVAVSISHNCTPADCEQRVAEGTIRRVSADEERARPSRGSMHCFSVVELAKGRRRAIDHPREQNDAAYAAGYKSECDLKHISAYLGGVYSAAACVSDISASFYGYELPLEARQFYRFRDATGALYEATRMMMGHTVAAELQHLLTCVVAGHRDYVEPNFATQCRTDVWIDNVRFHGTANLVAAARANLVKSSKECNVSFDVGDVVTEYSFIGVDFDHTNKTARLAAKTRDKLPASIPTRMTAHDLEGLIGRLIFSAAVRQEPLANNWWTLKWARRFFNKLNRGLLDGNDEIEIAGAARVALQHWLENAPRAHVVCREKIGSTAYLFTDATLAGWGAVLIFDNCRIAVAGGHFTGAQRAATSIGPKEAYAVVNAIDAFANQLRAVQQLNLFVDNTSVVAGIRRGQPRAASLVEPVREAWSAIIKSRISLFVDYVSTHVNPADAVSRGQRVEIAKVQQAMGQATTTPTATNKREGAVSRFVVK